MDLKDILKQLFSTMFVFRDNTHQLHVKCVGQWSMYFHPFLWDVYSFADWKLDWIMERAEFNHVELPKSYEQIQLESKILPYEIIEGQVDTQKQLVKEAMDTLCMYIDMWEKGCKESDTVLNTRLIDWKEELQILVRKNNRELWII